MITISIQLVAVKSPVWFMVNLTDQFALFNVINFGFYEGQQLSKLACNVEGHASVYDFSSKSWSIFKVN